MMWLCVWLLALAWQGILAQERQYPGDIYIKEILRRATEQVEPSLGRTLDTITDPNPEQTLTIKKILDILKRKGSEKEQPYPGDIYVNETLRRATEQVETSLGRTLDTITDPNAKQTPALLLKKVRFPTAATRRRAKGQEIVTLTIKKIRDILKRKGIEGSIDDLLSPKAIASIVDEAGCSTTRTDPDCSDTCFHSKYRTIDGTCNNLKHPLWGSSLSPLNRMVEAQYENDLDLPLGWTPGALPDKVDLPSARLVSTVAVSAEEINDDRWLTHMTMQWGQFLDHDMDLVPANPGGVSFETGISCSENCNNEMPCFPIPIPEDDPRITDSECMGFTRSAAVCGLGNSFVKREQPNEITSFIDASNIYGSSEDINNRLRNEADRAFLKHGAEVTPGKYNLPYDTDRNYSACDVDTTKEESFCFMAGDIRSNEQLGLTAMHTVWMREHNRIAASLKVLNSHWDSEKIYQETRKIVGAEIQKITYIDWIPKILDKQNKHKLDPYKEYDPTVDSTITNTFATAAFRFGHSMVKPVIERLGPDFNPISYGNKELHQAFFAPYLITEEGGIDPIIIGLIHDASKKIEADNMLNTELTEKLFELAFNVALDLAALNIQRGRDHGLPSYVQMRKYCGLSPIKSFGDLRLDIRNREVRRSLKDLYKNVRNIDLWVGGLAETTRNGMVGPVFSCIMGKMFKRLRDGDRFFYENPGVFTKDQLAELHKSSLARVLCDNGDALDRVQSDVFLRVRNTQEYVKCDDYTKIPSMDLSPWREDPSTLDEC